MGSHPGRLAPIRFPEDARQSEVDDPQPAVISEHQLRRRQLGVHEPLAVGVVETPARLQPDHQRLRRRQVAAAVEEVAEVPAGEIFDDGIDRAATADLLLAPVVHRRQIGVRDRRHLVHLLAKRAAKRFRLRQFRSHEFDRHGAIELGVVSVGDQRVGAGATRCAAPGSDLRSYGRRAPCAGGLETVDRLVGRRSCTHRSSGTDKSHDRPPQQITGMMMR